VKEGSTRCYLAHIGGYHPLGFTSFFVMILQSLTRKVLSIDLFLCLPLFLFSFNQLEFRMSVNISQLSYKWLDLFIHIFSFSAKLLFNLFSCIFKLCLLERTDVRQWIGALIFLVTCKVLNLLFVWWLCNLVLYFCLFWSRLKFLPTFGWFYFHVDSFYALTKAKTVFDIVAFIYYS
jgi:hypothetical protein